MICKTPKLFLAGFLLLNSTLAFAQKPQQFPWPEGKKMALSLSFDDARKTNIRQGTDLFDKYDVDVTFYIVPPSTKKDLDLWKKAVANGHEMGNHSMLHPCSGNFTWARDKALETYSMEEMRAELEETNKQIKETLGVTPTSYAYPCGHTTIGRGKNAQSFVPLISEMFLTGRGWLDEAPVDPTYCDFALITGVEMDGKDFEQVLPMIQQAAGDGQWLVLAGHETADSGAQTSRLAMLEKLIKYAQDPKNGIWIAPVGTVAQYVKDKRDKGLVNTPQIIYAEAGKEVLLSAETGRAQGKNISYMPEWKAFGWFTGKDKVYWDVEVPQTKTYQVILDWSVSNEEAGKEYILEGGEKSIVGKVQKSGSWETFKQVSIGQIKLTKGRNKLTFRPNQEFEKGALLDLRGITLKPIK
jgi:peptidoglycan/xylan/chitin deacetylase (PgdA/CDA1 family)